MLKRVGERQMSFINWFTLCGCNGWGWTMLKPGARNRIPVSHMGGRDSGTKARHTSRELDFIPEPALMALVVLASPAVAYPCSAATPVSFLEMHVFNLHI